MTDDDLSGLRAAAEGADTLAELHTREQKSFAAHLADREANSTALLAYASRLMSAGKLLEALASLVLTLAICALVATVVLSVKAFS